MSISVPKSKISQIQPDLSSHKNEKIITFINGLSKKVDAIISTPDSISWMEPILLTVSVPTSHITKIIYVNRSRGFVEGLWKGAIAGVATFIAIYLPSLGNHDSELIGGVVGSTIGGGIILVSPVVGAIIGHTEEFQFQSQ